METLRPIQRVVVMAFGLVLTALVALYVLPWAGREIVSRLPPTETPRPPTATIAPTATPTATFTPSPTPTPAITPPPAVALIEPITHTLQTRGNNGPAALSIAVSHLGYTDTQESIASLIQPGELDAYVDMEELAEFARSRGLEAHAATNGAFQTLRTLLANDFAVIVARWITTTETAETWHYQVLRGYDQASAAFAVHDTVFGPDVMLPYADMDRQWQVLGRPYMLVYLPEQEGLARAILGSEWERSAMWTAALARAQGEVGANAQNALAWLNRASALTELSRHEEALESFDQAQEIGLPPGLLSYRLKLYECLLNLKAYDELLALTETALAQGGNMERLYLYRALAYTALNDPAKARAAYEQALDVHPGWVPAEEGLKSISE